MLLWFIAKRIPQAAIVILAVSALTFFLLNASPGNLADAILGADATPHSVAVLSKELGLDAPIYIRYWHWLYPALHGNFESSILFHQTVIGLLRDRLPVSAELVVLAVAMSLLFAVPSAIIAARNPGGIIDRIIGIPLVIGLSVPGLLLAFVLILIFAVEIHWFPATGFVAVNQGIVGNLRSVCLPVVTMALPHFAAWARILRADLVSQSESQDYTVAARAKGLGPWTVLLRHALRNSSMNLVTLVAVSFGTLLGSTVIVETIFSLPGLGSLLQQSVLSKDYPVVQAEVVFIALIVIIANLIADILHSLIDPRVRINGTNR